MSSSGAVVLVSDRPDRSRNLADRLGAVHACRTIGLGEHDGAPDPTIAVITDVRFHRPATIEYLRRFLAQPAVSRAPILAVLREDSYLERVQAAAVGATFILPPHATFSEIATALNSAVRSTPAPLAPEPTSNIRQQIEQAGRRLGHLFDSAARGDGIDPSEVGGASCSVISAVSENGIREWLEIVWQYDNATYQHCLLVTGLAAEFARTLTFSTSDQVQLTKGALLHDIGKAKIPLAILNKPDALTAEEAAIMRTHVTLGCEMLCAQGNYDFELLDVVLRHHEMLDGSGYPDGVGGARISDAVRLVTICDIYAALIERRPYRPPLDPAQAFKVLQDMEGKLETALVRAFTPVAEQSAKALLDPPHLSAA